MKGDFTRETFRPQRHYWGVLRQQGRVDIDADWNEQIRIARHQDVVRMADLVGPSGGPIDGAGFDLAVDAGNGAVLIGAGRYYVGGVLCENEAPVALGDQPDPPADAVPGTTAGDAGFHLAYLDVWDRHVSALDDPTIREVALGGPDTATRARTVWQVRTRKLAAADAAFTNAVAALATAREDGDEAAEAAAMQTLRDLATAASCATPLDDVGGSLAADTGTMAARAVNDEDAADPCRFDPGGGGYTRLENRLYRVEIHEPGDETEATYKWSRDNGSVVVSVERFRTTKEVVVRRLGLDATQELNKDDWIEIVSDDLVAQGVPGQLVQIERQPDPADRILYLKDAIVIKDLALHPQVRRWDLPITGQVDVHNSWRELEAGIEVSFGDGEFHTGDYWVIPARANTSGIEWPPLPEYPGHDRSGESPEQLPPRGIAHNLAPVAALVHDGNGLVASVDLRALFPAATDLMDFAYAGGDGQPPDMSSLRIPQPLQVSVTNGAGPVTGVLVEFTVELGGGTLAGAGQTGATVLVPTGADGIASAEWTVVRTNLDHRVVARLLDDCGTGTRAPIYFNSRVNYQLHYLGGDGQEAMPGQAVEPLRVWVSDGQRPVEGAFVRFQVIAGGGTITPSGTTTPTGTAECAWELGPSGVQQVLAELVGSGGSLAHEAALTFTANLSLASTVSYTPAGDCSDLSGVSTVQEAIDELCRREGGGDCTYTIRAGDDVGARFAEIQASSFRDGAICFAEGTWEIDAPLTLTDKGDVTLRGLGRASRIVAKSGETAIRLDHCASVTVTDLAIVAERPTTHDGLGGGLSVVDSGPVTIERLAVVGPSGPEPLVSGIAVTRGPRAVRGGPIRIHDCDLATGEQQTGILVVNGDVVRIDGNTLGAAPFREGTRLREYLANARYRAAARRQLVDPRLELEVEPTDPGEPSSPASVDAGIMVRMSVGDSHESVTFRSTMTSGDVWTSLLREGATTRREVLARADAIADTVLRSEGALEDRRVFKTWFQEIEAKWVATGGRGIVVAGNKADDVRIVSNAISGHLQGISVALSADNRQLYRTGVAVIEGNTIALPGWSLVAQRTEGILLGSADSAIVDGNTVIVGGGYNEEPEIRADGIRAGGAFRARLLVRSNHFDAADAGIRIKLAQPAPPPHMRRWVASDNVNVGGECLVAPCEVMEDANVPARQRPACPLDRPI